MIVFIITEILRWLVLLSGIMDSWKYKLLSNKISRLKTSREHSRTFLNISIFNRFFLLLYSYFVLNDWVVTWCCIIALYTLVEAFLTIYKYYPYKKRGLKNFRKPSLWKYTLNSLIPNQIRKKL
jgi:hypothetical protein